MAKFTIIGFSNYNSELFSEMELPEGIDKDLLVDNILLKGGDYPVMYQDAEFMQKAIGIWARKWYATFERWAYALSLKYNPIENYDRIEETETVENGNTNTVTLGHDSSVSNAETNGKTNVYAFDSSAESPKDSTEGTSKSDALNDSIVEGTGNHSTSNKITGRIHGNIGVTTSQQMLQSEIDIAKFNLIEQVTDVFLHEFCIPIY